MLRGLLCFSSCTVSLATSAAQARTLQAPPCAQPQCHWFVPQPHSMCAACEHHVHASCPRRFSQADVEEDELTVVSAHDWHQLMRFHGALSSEDNAAALHPRAFEVRRPFQGQGE